MPERHTHLLHNVWSETSGLCRAVFLWYSVSVSASAYFGRGLVLFGSGDAGAPLFSGKSCLAMEAPVTSSNLTSSALLTSPDPDENDEHSLW